MELNVFNVHTWGDARAFLHVALPAIAAVLVAASYLASDVAALWVALLLVLVDTGLSTFNTANGFRKFFYPAAVTAGALLVRYGYTTNDTWALWTGLAPILIGGGVAAANTTTSTDKEPA